MDDRRRPRTARAHVASGGAASGGRCPGVMRELRCAATDRWTRVLQRVRPSLRGRADMTTAHRPKPMGCHGGSVGPVSLFAQRTRGALRVSTQDAVVVAGGVSVGAASPAVALTKCAEGAVTRADRVRE